MKNIKKTAFEFIILLGIVSLFGDITYEGGRSVAGAYLAVLGASASVVGLIAGIAEFIGYAFRLVIGYFCDRTKSYWLFTFIGYGLILAIPLLAFTNHWQIALILIIMERMGKAVRAPARDAMLSSVASCVGRGFGFGVHEAMDQIGAIIGPLTFSMVFLLKGGYRDGFIVLLIPAVLTIAILIMARAKVPSPQDFEQKAEIINEQHKGKPRFSLTGFRGVFWLYAVFSFFSVAGFVNFQLISYHFKAQSIVSDIQIPIFYAIGMAVDGVVALIIGKTYDKVGLKALSVIPILTLCIPLFVFSYHRTFLIIGVIIWGAVLGIHETIMRAAIGDVVSIDNRGFAYGIFNAIYGLAWFFGSVVMGLCYDISIIYVIIFAVAMEIVSVPILLFLRKES